MKYRVYTSGFIAALLATSSSRSAVGVRDRLTDIGLSTTDVFFRKNESDHLEVTATSERAMETISKMEPLPTLDAKETDARFMEQRDANTFVGTATYQAIIASWPIGKKPSFERWTWIVEDLVATSAKQKHVSSPKKIGVQSQKIGETV